MKKTIVIAVTVSVGLLGLFLVKSQKNQLSSAPDVAQAKIKASPPEPSVNQFISKSHASQQITVEKNNSDPSSCVEAWKSLVKADANTWGRVDGGFVEPTFVFGEESKLREFQKSLNYSSKCQLPTGHPLRSISDIVQQTCYTEKSKSAEPTKTMVCMESLMKLRFETIDYLTQSLPLESIQDVGLIGAKIYAQVMKSEENREPEKLIALSRRLLELEPDNRLAAEYWVHGAYLKKNGADSSENLQDFEKAVESLARKEPESPLAFEAQMEIARQRKEFSTVQNLGEQAKERGLNPQKVDYQLAWASYLDGKDEDSERYLEGILAKDPINVRAKSSLDFIKKGKSLPNEIRQNAAPFMSDLGGFKYGFSLTPTEIKSGAQ
jgi:hypothetical protein